MWQVEIAESALKQLNKLDRQVRERILTFLNETIAQSDNPREYGAALKGSELGNYWKYRVGEWRIICDIQDHKIVVRVLRIGNRREVYR